MKQLSILTSFAVLAAATACTVKEQEEVLPVIPQYEEFYATIEQPSETETKTYADDQFRVLWHADDRITIFNKYTYNQQYAFLGETGDNAGGFSKVGDDDFVTGNDLSDIYAVYPYQKGTKISNDGVITVSLPAEQTWADGSFGPGSNTMISATSDNKLKFRNTGSILAFKLYGSNVQVSTITLQGNNGERIAGKATVTMPVGGTPSVAMQSDATQSVTLDCATPVTIGTSAGSYTEFWFVVPPTDFAGGFTITVTCADGGTFEKSTEKSVSLARNHIYRMAPIEVVPQKPAAVPEYVDLGLSVKWATMNVGATKPEAYGDYFSWGETEPKSNYGWAMYKWYNGSNKQYSKYCTQSSYWGGTGPMDNKAVLDPEDDAAHASWGGSWRMPTEAEWYELITNCTWTWTSDYNGTGVKGQIVSASNGNSIFLPAAGSMSAILSYAGTFGYYWASSLSTYESGLSWIVQFNSDEAAQNYYQRFYGMSVRPVYGEFIPVSSISLDKTSLELYLGKEGQLTATTSPSNATEQMIHWASSDDSVAYVNYNGVVTALAPGTATITAYGSSGVSATCLVTVKSDLSLPASVEAVDLGLPSGLKWATMNVGATKPEEYGAYFAWGETQPKTDYSWSTYKWCNGSENTQTKYNTNSSYGTVDNKTVLDLEDDAAHVNWGGSWRIPTDDEWTELRENCTWTWTDNYNGTGVAGDIVTSNKPGYSNKSIFFAAAGCRQGTKLNSVGSYGAYWSSSLYLASTDISYRLYFNYSRVSRSNYGRHFGFSVRPVYGEIVPVSGISIPETTTLPVGMSETLTATVLPENATYRNLTWTSSDESVATVDATGKVTAVAIGKATVTAYSADASTTAACEVTVYQLAQSITLDHTELELYVGDAPVTLTATVLPSEYTMKTITWKSSDSSIATVDSDGKVTAISAGTTKISALATDGSNVSAACMVTVKINLSLPDAVEAVDLGLPSGLKWASMNVGATKPEEYGEYFAWGETQPKSNYSWSTYKFELGTDKNGPFSKYVNQSNYGTVDNKTVLDPEDDAAHVNWGGSWRMPTLEECDELINKCTWTWTTQNGVNGRLVTGPNGKSIFLPAAGDRYDTYLYYAGSWGYYWSSSLYTYYYPNYAYDVLFYSDNVFRNNNYRYYGFSVRPVSE